MKVFSWLINVAKDGESGMSISRSFNSWGPPSSLGQAHASTYHRSLAVSSTTISYSVYVPILGVCLRFKPHWMFQIYKYVIKGREELTCSSLIHSHMIPLLDVPYRQVGNLSFGKWRVPPFRELGTQWHQREIPSLPIYLTYHTNGNKQTMLSVSCQRLIKGSLIGRSFDTQHSRYLAI